MKMKINNKIILLSVILMKNIFIMNLLLNKHSKNKRLIKIKCNLKLINGLILKSYNIDNFYKCIKSKLMINSVEEQKKYLKKCQTSLKQKLHFNASHLTKKTGKFIYKISTNFRITSLINSFKS